LKLECTFKPKLDERSAALAAKASGRALHPTDTDSVLERVAQQARDREAKLERLRKEKQAAELKECTFAPKVREHKKEKGDAAAAGGDVTVRGLGRYMELKQMAREQAEALRQREQKAFILEPCARNQPYTVPEPFKMHEGGEAATERTARMLKEVEQARQAECTFHPKTNEASTKQLIKRASSML